MAESHLTKRCAACSVEKSISEFRKVKSRYYAYCNPCGKEYARRHYLANKDKYRQKSDEWRAQNPERYKQANQAYYARTREQAAAKHVEYYWQNREACLARCIGWRKADPTKARQNEAAYRERNREACNARIAAWKARNKGRLVYYTTVRQRGIKRATPPWVRTDELLAFYDEARKLTAETGTLYHVDHIVPINNGLVCGLHVPWNLRVVTAAENVRKGNRLVEKIGEGQVTFRGRVIEV